MQEEIKKTLAACIKDLFKADAAVELTRPEEQFGDYATNVALQLAKQLDQPPREVAETLAKQIEQKLAEKVSAVSVAGPGFINLMLSDRALIEAAAANITQAHKGRRVLLEYSCPNAFKELHAGHLYQTVVGDALGRILEASGATVFRANFGGDVGLHVAKCLYGVMEKIGGQPAKLDDVLPAERPQWLSAAYVLGAKAYEEDSAAKAKIDALNKQIYNLHDAADDRTSDLAQIYWECREWSYDYFKDFYKKVQVEAFDKYYPESAMIAPGLALVNKHTGKVFTPSDGAIVYAGQDAGLHTRVFITSKGLPTYETKDLGVIFTEADDFPYDERILITGNDQTDYMKVVFAALHAIDSQLAAKQTHLTNGTIRFGDGQKMSSRLGNVSRAIDVIEEVSKVVAAENPDTDYYTTTLAAVKYSFLRHRLGGDIAFDVSESVSLEGNSGPYLQYAHARARSILRKADGAGEGGEIADLAAGERPLARKISEYPEVVEKAIAELLPHHICTYLYELAQTFNRFYEQNRVIGDKRQAARLALVARYANTLRSGLALLGIASPDKM